MERKMMIEQVLYLKEHLGNLLRVQQDVMEQITLAMNRADNILYELVVEDQVEEDKMKKIFNDLQKEEVAKRQTKEPKQKEVVITHQPQERVEEPPKPEEQKKGIFKKKEKKQDSKDEEREKLLAKIDAELEEIKSGKKK